MTETEKPEGKSVVPPTVPITGVNVPDPTTGSEPEDEGSADGQERRPDDPSEAAKDGSA